MGILTVTGWGRDRSRHGLPAFSPPLSAALFSPESSVKSFLLPWVAACACLLALLCGSALRAQETHELAQGQAAETAPRELQQARAWVQQMGHEDYTAREEAADRL